MSLNATSLAALVGRLAGRRIVVLGDVILDDYIAGRPTRLSREAPVPVLEYQDRFCRPGGAANPAVNIRALGSCAELVSVVGDDSAADALREELSRAGLGTDGLVAQHGATAAKLRLLARHGANLQHVARLDYPAPPPGPAILRALLEKLQRASTQSDAILVSDYKGGVLDEAIVGRVREISREVGLLTAADSQGDLGRYAGLDLVKCNQPEAEAALSRLLTTQPEVERAGDEIVEKLGVRYFVLTRGPDGLSLFERDRAAIHLAAANPSEVFDVTGAGDTVIAVLTLALVAGATLVEAAQLANAAAGLVVRRLGVATVSPAELLAAVAP